MPINQRRPDTPLANSPEPRFVQDSIKKPKTWQKMNAEEKGAKKAELVKKGGMERFLQYKDSVSTEATNRREASINKAAADKKMTRAQYERWYAKNEKKDDAKPAGLQVGKACKRTDEKGSCVDGKTRGGDSLNDIN